MIAACSGGGSDDAARNRGPNRTTTTALPSTTVTTRSPGDLAAAAVAMLALLAVNRRVRLRMGDEADVTPSMPLPDLVTAFEPLPEDELKRWGV